MSQKWKLPAPGDIIWCLFPEVPNIEPEQNHGQQLSSEQRVVMMAIKSAWCTALPSI